MSASLTLSGLSALVKALDVMPDGLQTRAESVVREAAFDTATELRSALALGPTGNLRKRVAVKKRDPLRYTVISGAPHAFINEEGTKRRTTKRSKANRGISPASKTVARVASDRRRQMNGELERVLVQVLGTVR